MKDKVTKDFIHDMALGVVVNTGFYTVKGQLVRYLLFQETPEFKFTRDSFKYLSVIFVITLVGFLWNVFYIGYWTDLGLSAGELIVRSLDLFTAAIPPALPLCLLIGVDYSVHRLKNKQVFTIINQKINEAGRVKVFCFDKTGTLTENSLSLAGVVVSSDKYLDETVFSSSSELMKRTVFKQPKLLIGGDNYFNEMKLNMGSGIRGTGQRADTHRRLVEAMGLCHSLSYFKQKLLGDPLEVIMFNDSGFSLVEQEGGTLIFPSSEFSRKTGLSDQFRFRLVQRLDFTPIRKRMSVLVVKGLTKHSKVMSLRQAREKLRFRFKRPERKKSLDIILSSSNEMSNRKNIRKASVNLRSAEKLIRNVSNPVGRVSNSPDKLQNQEGIKRTIEDLDQLDPFEENVEMEQSDDTIGIYCKGAPEVIRGLCRPDTVPEEFDYVLEKHSTRGLRVLAVSYRAITQSDILKLKTAAELERDMIFVGFILFENPLKPKTRLSLIELRHAGIGTVMITGDNLLTAVSVAQSSGMVDESQKILRVWVDEETDRVKVEKAKKEKQHDEEEEMAYKHFDEFDEVIIARNAEKECKLLGFRGICESLNESQEEDFIRELNPSSQDRRDQTGSDSSEIVEMMSSDINPGVVYAMTGQTLDLLIKKGKLTPALLMQTKVFGRSNPTQKATIVAQLQNTLAHTNKNDFVGFCGDGANDCSALKKAHVGLSLTQTEASIAAPFSTTIPDISAVSVLLLEGKCCLETAVQNFQFITFCALSQFFGQIILYYFESDFPNGHYYYMDLVVVFVFIFLISRIGPKLKLTSEFPRGDLLNFQVLIRLTVFLCLHLAALIVSIVIIREISFFKEQADITGGSGFGSEDYFFTHCIFIFIVVSWAYMASVLVFGSRAKFKARIFNNQLMLVYLALNVFFILVFPWINEITLPEYPRNSLGFWVVYYLQYAFNMMFRIKKFIPEFTVVMFLYGLLTFLMYMLFDFVVVGGLISVWRNAQDKKLNQQRRMILGNEKMV